MREWRYAVDRLDLYLRAQHFVGPLLLLLLGTGLAASAGGSDGDAAMLALTALPVGFVIGATFISSESATEQLLVASWFGSTGRPWVSRVIAVQALLVVALATASALLATLNGAPAEALLTFVAAFVSGAVGAVWGLALRALAGKNRGLVMLGGPVLLVLAIPLNASPLRWIASPAPRLVDLADGAWSPLLTSATLQGATSLLVAVGALAAVARLRPLPG